MSDLDNVMLRIGRVVAADRALQVEVRGVDAYSTPGRVVLPNIENFAWLGENAERMLHGILDHECGHAKFSDHSIGVGDARGQAFLKLHNAIEDGWIERAIAAEWPGARFNLDRKNRWFWEDATWQQSFADADAWTAYLMAATLYTRGAVTLDEIRAKREDAADMVESSKKLLDRVPFLRTTRSAFGIANDVWAHFKKEAEEPPPPPPGGGGDEEEEGPPDPKPPESSEEPEDDEDEGGSDGEPDEEPSEAPGSPGEGEGDEGSTEDEEMPPPAGGEGEGGSGEEESGETPEAEAGGDLSEDTKTELRDLFEAPESWEPGAPVNPEEAIREEIKLALVDGPEEYINFSSEFDHERDLTVDTEGTKIAEPIDAIEADAHAAGDAFAQAFEVALRAMRYKRPIGGADEGEIDEQLLAEFAVGSASADTLYRQHVAEDDRDVVVSILIDCSGSMNGKEGKKVALARRAAAAISMALSRCQIAHEITGFTCVSSDDRGFERHPWLGKKHGAIMTSKFSAMRAALAEAQRVAGTHPGIYARELYSWHGGEGPWYGATLLVPMHVVFKTYDLESLAGLSYVGGIHENLDGEAVLWQARRLASRPEPRRVMFVLSDGWPAGARRAVDEGAFLKRSIERVVSAGIEIYGIGICSDAVAEFYPKHWVARRIDDLMEIAFGSLVEVLTEGRNETECVRLD